MKKKEFLTGTVLLAASSALCLRLLNLQCIVKLLILWRFLLFLGELLYLCIIAGKRIV